MCASKNLTPWTYSYEKVWCCISSCFCRPTPLSLLKNIISCNHHSPQQILTFHLTILASRSRGCYIVINWVQAVTTPLLEDCEDDTHTPEMGTWESSRTLEISEFDWKGQNTSPWSVDVIEKLLKCRCRKWPHMSHLDIYSISYGKKKGRESNWQFHSRPLKVRNRPDPGVWRWSATHCWKALKESYKFASNLIPIGGLSRELWTHKVSGVQTGTISGLLLGSRGTKSHSDVGAAE